MALANASDAAAAAGEPYPTWLLTKRHALQAAAFYNAHCTGVPLDPALEMALEAAIAPLAQRVRMVESCAGNQVFRAGWGAAVGWEAYCHLCPVNVQDADSAANEVPDPELPWLDMYLQHAVWHRHQLASVAGGSLLGLLLRRASHLASAGGGSSQQVGAFAACQPLRTADG